MHKFWNPHDCYPVVGRKNYYARLMRAGLGPRPEQAWMSPRWAMVQTWSLRDNLPSYHREIAMNMGMDGAWGQWVNRWTAEENRHGIALRDYLVVTDRRPCRAGQNFASR